MRISNRGAKSNSNDNATADSHNPEEDGTEHRTDNTDDGHSREEDQSNSTPATYTVWLCPICGKQVETNVIECSKCLNWLHYKCKKMTVSTYRTHAISNDLEYNCKSCKCMKEMNELTELYQRGDEVEESSIDTTTNNIPTTEETNPKNVIVNTNTIDEMVICEETGLKYVMPSATTLTKNPVKTNKKAKARNQLEIDEETGLKTTIEKNKTGNSKITNNSNEPSRTLESTADNSLAKNYSS